MQTRSQPAICPSLFIQIPAIRDMKVKYTLIGVEACEIICLKLTSFLPARLVYNYPQMSDADSSSDKPV